MANLFDLLDLADGESGEAAVSVVVAKRKTEAAADPAAAASTAQEKPATKNVFFTKLQFDNGIRNCQHELKGLREVLIKLRQEETKLKEQGATGNEVRLVELSKEQRRLRQEQRKLREEESRLEPLRKEFYLEHGFPYVDENAVQQGGEFVDQEESAPADCANGGCDGANANGGDGTVCYDGGDQDQPEFHSDGDGYSHGYGEEGGAYYNGGRQGNRGGQPKRRMEYRPKVKASSDAGAEAEPNPEEKVSSEAGTEEAEHKVVSVGEAEQKEATAASSDTVAASESEQSAGDAAANNVRNNGQTAPGNKRFVPRQKLNGSEKRKLKNSKKSGGNGAEKAKKEDSEAAVTKRQADKVPQRAYVREEEQKVDPSAPAAMTLAEYEKMLEEKKKASEAARTERKVTAEEFEGLKVLEKRKLDAEEAVLKAEKVQLQHRGKQVASKKEEPEAKEGAAAKDGKPKKVALSRKDLGFKQPPRRTYDEEGGSSNGRFNGGGGGFQGRSRDNLSAGQTEAGNDGNGAPRGGYYNGRGDGAPRGDYNSVGRGGFRGNGGGYSRGNGGYQPQQQQGGYQQQDRAGNGGQAEYPRRQGNGTYYRQRGGGSYGGGRGAAPASSRTPAKEVEVVRFEFPPLPEPASARAAAPASAPDTAPAPTKP
ncbi:hypothetical protein BS78_01G012800 [Paspalum vaginatum]|nr:hypothetical protein BS78_01G012800 [Paspalum vaginatum]